MDSDCIHDYMTVKDSASYLNIPLPTLYYYVKQNIIPSERMLGCIIIHKSDLELFKAKKEIHDSFKVSK